MLGVSQNPYRRQLILQRWANITATNGWDQDKKHRRVQASFSSWYCRPVSQIPQKTAEHEPHPILRAQSICLCLCLCRHFIALHFLWKCILDASYCKCSWHCPDKYALHTLIISSNFSDESTNQASNKFVVTKHCPSERLTGVKWRELSLAKNELDIPTDRHVNCMPFVIFWEYFWA